MIKIFINMLFVSSAFSQMLVGGSRDDHNCVLDGGYQYCSTTDRCYRPWEESCPPHDSAEECGPCPPPPPCPMPYMPEFNMDNCKMTTNNDACGCPTGCPHYDCSNGGCNTDSDCHSNQFCRSTGMRLPMVNGRRLQMPSDECVDKSDVGSSCGGYTPPELQSRCLDNLECVNTRGPMIADASGECRELCIQGERRDDTGNCIETPGIPDNCVTWNDGCNTCQVSRGRADICTLMYCFRQAEPYCMHFSTDPLREGEICYRFCEDGSQENINRRDGCPENTQCISESQKNSVSMISYDSCGSRAMTCQITGH